MIPGQKVVAKYRDMIKHVTYPTTSCRSRRPPSLRFQLAADKDVKAIVICRRCPERGCHPASSICTRREVHQGFPEDPYLVAETADIALERITGPQPLSFGWPKRERRSSSLLLPRHMSMELLAQRRDIMKDEATGSEFIFVTAPDPTNVRDPAAWFA